MRSPPSAALLFPVLATVLAGVAPAQLTVSQFSGVNPGDEYGRAVAVIGDVDGDLVPDVAMGIPGDDTGGNDAGAVEIHSGADGTIITRLFGSRAGERFGAALASAGDFDGDGRADLIAGAPTAAGLVRVVSGADGSDLLLVTGGAGDQLGTAVAGDADFDNDGFSDVAMGAPGAGGRGQVRLYSGRNGRLLQTLSGNFPGDRFGAALATLPDIDGDGNDEVLVGIPGLDAGGVDAGGARIYSPNGRPLREWTGDAAGDGFGSAVARGGDIDGDGVSEALVGAPFNDAAAPDGGQVSALSGADGTRISVWFGRRDNDNFGTAVSGGQDLDGDNSPDVMVGVPGRDTAGLDAGAVEVFAGFDARPLYEIHGTAAGDGLGTAVDLGDDTNSDGYADMVAGMPGNDTGGADAGAAWLRSQNPYDGVAALLSRADAGTDGKLGGTLAITGDVNGDGTADYVSGARHDNGQLGSLWVYSGLDQSVLHTFWGDAPGDSLGTAVASAGDVDGDGLDDIIAGAWHEQSFTFANGMARVYSGATGAVLHTFYGTSYRDHMGTAVGGIGDVDGDGVPDLAVGLGIRFRNTEEGSVWVYSGATGNKLYEVDGKFNFEWFGWKLAALHGDLNGDGVPDFIAAGPQYLPQVTGPGLVRAISGVDGAVLYSVAGIALGDRFGNSLHGLGDIDDDGAPDFVVGATEDDVGAPDAGAARVYSGATGALLAQWVGENAGDRFGAVGSGGDADGDGLDDIAVGATGYDGPAGADAGRIYIYSSRTFALLVTIEGTQSSIDFGVTTNILPDTDGDGYGEVVAGAQLADDNGMDSGRIEVFTSLAASQPGSARTFGIGCATADGKLMRLAVEARPQLGRRADVSVRAGPASSVGLIAIGDSATQWSGVPLPLALGPAAPACSLTTNMRLTIPVGFDALGQARVPLGVPANAGLLGAVLYMQFAAVSPGANPLGVALSDTAEIRIGELHSL